MKINYPLLILIILGIIILFFFPEPETNFLAYVGTATFFIVAIIALLAWQRRKK